MAFKIMRNLFYVKFEFCERFRFLRQASDQTEGQKLRTFLDNNPLE